MEPVLVIKSDRSIYLIMAFVALGMSALFTIFGIVPDFFSAPDPFSRPQEISVMQAIIFSFFALIGLFLCYVWVKQFISDTPAISIYQNGFEANTNGVATGFINWTDIEKIEEVMVSSNSGSGTRKEAAVAVYLKEPSVYTNRLPIFFQWVMKLATKSGRYKHTGKYGVEDSTPPLFLPVAAFGMQYTAAITLMYAGIKQKRGTIGEITPSL
ncbi:STM3941 family protein [Lacibacter sp. H407]|uniref:STM3941 family protein n=1 Tax=Lacibacter sp. H407 TaxID=3133423 RepID=UPI0030BCEECA